MGLHRRVWDGAASSLREAEEAEDALRAEDRAVPWAPPDAAGVWLPNKMGQQASCLQGLNSCSSSFVQCHHPHGLSRSPRFALAYVVSHVRYSAIIVGGLKLPFPSCGYGVCLWGHILQHLSSLLQCMYTEAWVIFMCIACSGMIHFLGLVYLLLHSAWFEPLRWMKES